MRKVILLLFLCHAASAVTHSLKYFYTASSGIPNFPEFVSLGVLDGQQMDYYDSNIKKVIPKEDWMAKSEGPEYWETQTEASIVSEQTFKENIKTAKKRFNQTGAFSGWQWFKRSGQGVHIVQYMYGCEWDEETGEGKGYEQYGYDGEDFVAFDLKTETWIAPTPEAVITKHKWDEDKAEVAFTKNYLTQECVDWLKKYLNFGRSSLTRTELPSVSLLQKSPSSPVSCHATGFYPDRALMLWRKDGEDLHEDVDQGEILPNHDGSFQMSVDLKLSSVKPEDWGRYECVFQLSGVKEDIVKRLDKAVIETNETSTPLIAIIIAAVVILVAIIGGVGFFIYRKKSAKRPPSPVNNPEVMEELNPKA